MLRWLTAGESHGRALVAVCEGVPAGVEVTTADVAGALARRRAGYGRGARMKFEQDEVELTGGVRHGVTLGGPIAIRIANTEWAKWETVLAPDPVRCADQAASQAMQAEVDAARRDGDTLGGVIEVIAYGLPPGLGSHVHWDRRLDGRLAGALMSIQAIKGIEVGDGFATAARRGSQAHDEIVGDATGIRRITNRAGGIEGGMSTGEPIRLRAAMKPISTVPRALATVDVRTGEPARAINQRSDVTAVPAAGVVAEAMAALVLADAVLEKFGGDCVTETARNAEAYLKAMMIR